MRETYGSRYQGGIALRHHFDITPKRACAGRRHVKDGDMADDPREARGLGPDAFGALIARHQHPLHVYLTGLMGNAEQAFDLVQETFYDAWRAARKGKPP